MNKINKEISITFPDGTVIKKPYVITGLNIAEDISSSLAKQSVAIEVNSELRDLSRSIIEDASINIIKKI